jgi:CRISPR-associated DxTHG motif protein
MFNLDFTHGLNFVLVFVKGFVVWI